MKAPQVVNLWQCANGHILSHPAPIPGKGDEKGKCPYPCLTKCESIGTYVKLSNNY